MLANYGYIGLFVVVAIFFAVTTILLPVTLRFLGIIPRKATPVKTSTFECGMETIGKTWVQFNFRYYFYALVFIALDVLVVFLFPWAVALRQLGLFGFIAIIILIGITVYFIGYLMLAEVLVFLYMTIFGAPEIYMRYITHMISIGFKLISIAIIINGFIKR